MSFYEKVVYFLTLSNVFFICKKNYTKKVTKERNGFKIQIFKVSHSEVTESTDKFLCLYDLTWETKTTL